MEIEIWKDIPGYEGLYQISNLGFCKSLTYGNKWGKIHREKILKIGITPQGYHVVNLYKNLKVKQFLISRLVAQGFLGLDINDRKILACHKDDNTSNNRADNIFLGTHSENTQDMVRKGRCKPLGKYSRGISQYSKDGTFIKEYKSPSHASRELSLNLSHICCCINNSPGRKSHGGFIWKYT